jgi:hypothetical protein
MFLAIQPPKYLIKLARMSALQLIHFKDRLISGSRSSYLNRKFDPSQHFASMNMHQTTSMMASEVHSSIGLGNHGLKR